MKVTITKPGIVTLSMTVQHSTAQCIAFKYWEMNKLTASYIAEKINSRKGAIRYSISTGLTPTEASKKYYTDIGKLLKCDLKVTANIIKGHLKESLKDDGFKWLNKLARGKGGAWNTIKGDKVLQCLSELNQAETDRLLHITPIIPLFGSVQKAKAVLGKGSWKKICKNSFSRNMLISSAVALKTTDITELNTIPSTLLKKYRTNSIKLAHFPASIKHAKKVGLAKFDGESFFTTLYDTHYMCHSLNLSFNNKWSIKRLHKEHDKCSTTIKENQLKEEMKGLINSEFSSCSILPEKIENFYLATDPEDILLIGIHQRHCVIGYTDQIRVGLYAIYYGTVEDQFVTIGIGRDGGDQAKGFMNSDETSPTTTRITNKVKRLLKQFVCSRFDKPIS